jgi:hypothetical protein
MLAGLFTTELLAPRTNLPSSAVKTCFPYISLPSALSPLFLSFISKKNAKSKEECWIKTFSACGIKAVRTHEVSGDKDFYKPAICYCRNETLGLSFLK